MTEPRTLILDYIHQHDNPVYTKQLINFLLENIQRKDAWNALDSLKEEGYIAELGGSWYITPSGMDLMGWLV